MKKAINLVVASLLASQSIGLAQTNTPNVAVVAGGGSGQTGFLSAGDYNINKNETDFTQAMLEIIKNNSKIQQQDREYLQAKGKVIGDSLRGLVEKKQAFVKLGQSSAITTTVTLDQVLAQVNDINAAVEKIQIDIQEASLISSDTLPSATASVGKNNITTGPASVIDMSKAMGPFAQTLTKLTDECNSVTFKTVGHKGAFNPINAPSLTPDLSMFPQMTQEEIEAAVLKVQQLQVIGLGTQRQQQLWADQVVQLVKAYIQQVGTDQFLRPRNGNDFTYLGEAYKSVEKMFLLRSYLRKKYGIQIGAIQPQSYPVVYGNLEGIFKKDMLLPITGALNKIMSQTARTDTDLMVAYNSARQYVEFYDRSLTPTLSADASKKRDEVKKDFMEKNPNLSQLSYWQQARAQANLRYNQFTASFAKRSEILAGKKVVLNNDQKDVAYNSDDTGVMARVSGLTTFFTGQTSTVEALLAVFRLILSDIREEVMLSQGDWNSLQSYHDKLYLASDAQTVRSVGAICDVDTKLSPAARQRASALTSGKVSCVATPTGLLGQLNTGNTIVTTIRNLMTTYETVEMKKAQDARNLRTLVDQSLASQAQAGDKPDDAAIFNK